MDCKNIDRDEAFGLIRAGANIIDVRTVKEFNQGHLAQAVNIPHTEILSGAVVPSFPKEQALIVYCAAGVRAEMAAQRLVQLGFRNVFNAGGYEQLLPDQV